jgi:hypothetical protein
MYACGPVLSLAVPFVGLTWRQLSFTIIAEGIIEGVRFMHTKGILHGDVKPANIGVVGVGVALTIRWYKPLFRCNASTALYGP